MTANAICMFNLAGYLTVLKSCVCDIIYQFSSLLRGDMDKNTWNFIGTSIFQNRYLLNFYIFLTRVPNLNFIAKTGKLPFP